MLRNNKPLIVGLSEEALGRGGPLSLFVAAR